MLRADVRVHVVVVGSVSVAHPTLLTGTAFCTILRLVSGRSRTVSLHAYLFGRGDDDVFLTSGCLRSSRHDLLEALLF